MTIGPVMMDIEGTALTDEDRALIQHPCVGGVIYFSRNYVSIEQMTALTTEIRQLRPGILVAVDQEGGRVQRFKKGFTRLPAMQKFLPLYRKRADATLALVQDCGWLMAVELLAIGIDFSFAPVLDVDDNQCSVIADRSFSNKPEEVVELAGAFIRGMSEAGMAATGKHFPGHGSVKEDSHFELPHDHRSYQDIFQHDLIPFRQLLPSLNAVMPAHIVFSKVDRQPVGFSTHWLQTILRQELQFNGIIFSDDLTMKAAGSAGSYSQRAQAALIAGCDIILVCNQRSGVIEVLDMLSSTPGLLRRNTCLASMSATKKWAFETLATHSRYRKTCAIINTLVGL
ncbi:beta-N-acetylhexosaminidase [Candidatus Endobugula sertula]|uniref:Beta-hexosaminidase n=1 Tax=Candidatus Endobugula sertula TaxID=62101 RepID=A0A1D2QSV1_9GAMM|nr:beta-N-acetylhexosaminidase [Candidatus Endobugula sertula]